MVSSEVKELSNNMWELANLIEESLDVSDIENSLSEQAKDDLLAFLCCLAITDDIVVMQEIEFINGIFDSNYNLLEIKKMGRNYDSSGWAVIPAVIEKAVEYDLAKDDSNSNLSQTLVNAFYYIGLELIACDDDIAGKEVKVLTDIILNYQAYVKDKGLVGEFVDVFEDMRNRRYIESEGDTNYIVEHHHKPNIIPQNDLQPRDSEFTELLKELEDKKYSKVRNNMFVLINTLRIRNIRKQRGLKNNPMPQTMILLGGDDNDINNISEFLSKVYNIEGVTAEGFVTKFNCNGNVDNLERINQTLNLSKTGNMLVMQADGLSVDEVDCIINSTKKNKQQLVFLSGNTNRLISFLEKNREINSNITSSLYLEGISEELLCDVFEFLCIENDYKLSKDAKKILKNHFHMNIDKNDPFYLFEIFDRCVQKQNQRIMSEIQVDSDSMVTIEEEDIRKGII